MVDAYTLAYAVLMLWASVVGDRFGLRGIFTGGIGLFAPSAPAWQLVAGQECARAHCGARIEGAGSATAALEGARCRCFAGQRT